MKRLAGGTENASQKLSAEAYNKDTRALEEELGELGERKRALGPELCQGRRSCAG